MSLDKAELCDSLLTWLQTFQVPSCNSKQDLTSGVAIAHVLNIIDPAWFNETWLGRIKEESEDNWRLKVSNLKKILKSILEYYHDVLGHQVLEEHLPDVNLIGEMGDITELGKLVQLVLGCAVSCEKKQEQIQQIMTLEESVQHVVMTAIQELLSREPSSEPGSPETYGDFDYQSRKYYFLSEEAGEKEDLRQRCQDLEHQLSVAQEEKLSLQTETRSLKEKLNRCDSLDVSGTAITGKKLLLLQSQMEQLQDENYRLENSRDDLRLHADMLERELANVQQRNEDLNSLAQEAQGLKDEMDILRHSSDRVNQLETLVETYKRKLEDLGDLRRQVRLLEERNTVYMQRTCELEEELRRANVFRSQMDTYKKQAHELLTKHQSEAMKAEKWQFEYKNLYDKYEALQKEKGRLMTERDTLRETNDELRCAQVQQKCLSDAGSLCDNEAAVGNLAAEIMPTELAETMVRLQSENKMLCVQEETYRQKLAEVQTDREEAQRSKNALETQNRLQEQQMSELRSQVEELQKALQAQDSKTEDSSLLKKKLEEHLEKLHEAHTDLQKKREDLDDLEPKVDSNMAKKIDELQEILRKKDEDMKQMEERYKRYVDKARTVVKTLDPKPQPATVTPDIKALKNQLTEKDRKIHYLERDYEKSRSRHDQEEKLIISAWYNMGMTLHQRMAGERLSSSGQAMSFLAQQRMATNARRGLTRPQPR
ncbi:protein Hook homolog 2 [Syngnathus scovelli]|uniref:protein Hook homolog 2 n=1 Tax=Syngnathus scovelli TaxID=161590 RepID=UPI00210F983F|nr:protein Hook homolog 2 [Syngnathus scovelli]XP_049601967.1 protein Hook homolog 2 [Syngnathus scovelli]XP_049601968.1 protein Hook homolog 2 [Syngnathus scovelli]XP_049601969.1 protein Hook homolog 2 [Syngnathus scovelli]XP_049601970.1 protein Hook homolog 2 [Syngnathus scovelli]XP_049601971.1 protein Hook homolog 2 [Syngnathus scovelli]XP_049601972.1 protein Hook homolog 2 [Syngnathus scovelli]XP_049601973.1 protein Hook homolog 2 [Syngnathus scovelli]XP_049601974.1 protein Hook homolog